MQRQSIKIKSNRHYVQNEPPSVDWLLTGGIFTAGFLALLIIWGIGQALGL